MTAPLQSRNTLRIPRSLWSDLEETVIQQDRQFLTDVARSLGLPVQEVLRKCLGTTGAPTSIPILWAGPKSEDEHDEICPWWECHGDGLWRRCPRIRLSDTMPCAIHERTTTHPMARLNSDPYIQGLGYRVPVWWQDALYWVDPDCVAPPFREDGSVVTDGTFRRVIVENEDGEEERVWAWTCIRLT
jgi:hypothetical protein